MAPHEDVESGYASASSSQENSQTIILTPSHLKFLNQQLNGLEPQDIMKWSITSLPSLYQTTSFGLTGLVTIDMLSKLDLSKSQQPELIFLDTLYHFSETVAMVERVRQRYPQVKIHVYKPAGASTAADFEAIHGQKLWETDDQRYDWLAKVEPAQRAYRELGVAAVLTGRRRSQGAKRGGLDVVDVDDAGLIKINPLANWSFQQVRDYIKANNVPYNELLDRGYKSVGDWHSTQPVAEGEEERSGRWSGQQKTECGIHNPRSKYAQFLREQELKKQGSALHSALSNVSVGA